MMRSVLDCLEVNPSDHVMIDLTSRQIGRTWATWLDHDQQFSEILERRRRECHLETASVLEVDRKPDQSNRYIKDDVDGQGGNDHRVDLRAFQGQKV